MKKSFALIYTLLFITLLLITVVATWVTGMADIRLSRRSESSVQAFQLAQAGIEDGWVRYKNAVGTTDQVQKTFPDNASDNVCDSPSKVRRVDPNASTPTEDTVNLIQTVTLSEQLKGIYDLRYCWDTTINKEVIEGIGYYQGNKITLKAEVDHSRDYTEPTPCGGPSPEPACTWNHSKDTLTIYQTGPSQ